MLRVVAFAGLLTLGACQIVSLPPSSSRADGGPVASRGVVSHEARSQVRIYRDAAGCQSVQTVNRQYRVVTVDRPEGPQRVVLEESYDVRRCLSSESVSSEAAITAWRPDSGVSAPLFRITGRGTAGEPFGNLYRMTSHGCCGSQDASTYYSLITGETLFTSSAPLRSLEIPSTRTVRYAAFHDSFSASDPVEAATDSTVIGVIEWGDDVHAARRVVVRSDHPEPFATSAIRFVKNGKPVADSVLSLRQGKPVGALGLEVELVAPGSSRRLVLRVPIVDLELVVGRATVPSGVRLAGGA